MDVPPPIKSKKSYSVISWLGFGMSIVLLLLIWIVNILVFKWANEPFSPIMSLFMLEILVGGLLGIFAISFSIIGLVLAIKNDTPKWIGTSGIVVCVLSLFSFFVPIFCAGMIKKETVKIELPNPASSNLETEIVDDITIQIFAGGKVCFINNKDNDCNIDTIETKDLLFNKRMSNWLSENGVDHSTRIIVKPSTDADYTDIIKVVDVLQVNGLSKFRISSYTPPSDDD